MAKQQMTKRQRLAVKKRDQIMSSKAYRDWYKWRHTFYPTPRDPYRAFMIDLGLRARVHHKDVWKHRTNRIDYPPIDLPRGVPRTKRRLPPRKQIKRFKKRPKATQPIVETPYEQQLRKEVEKFTGQYNLPEVEVKFEPRERGAFYRPSIFGKPLIVMPRSRTKGVEKLKGKGEMPYITILHEAGHHAHAAYGGLGRAAGASKPPTELSHVITKPFPMTGTIQKERIAWEVAKTYTRKRPIGYTPRMGWRKKYAFGTYLGTTPLW